MTWSGRPTRFYRPNKTCDESESFVNTTRSAQRLQVGLALALVLAVAFLAGCSGSSAPTTPKAANLTAKQAYAIAVSTLSTVAPDGKLLVGESTQPITTTSTADWQFLVGSPKTDVIYSVFIQNGKGQFEVYGKAGLAAAEWNAVPGPDAWKIDSDVAHQKAVAVYPNGKDAAYFLGFVTYVPKAQVKTQTQPMKWFVSFDPSSRGKEPTSTVEVDMGTGAAALSK